MPARLHEGIIFHSDTFHSTLVKIYAAFFFLVHEIPLYERTALRYSLMRAAGSGNTEIVQLLLDAGADSEAKDEVRMHTWN